MTPEQKELEDVEKLISNSLRAVESYWKAYRRNKNAPAVEEMTGDGSWKPIEIPWHNPEGVTQEQLGEGYRFLTSDEIDLDNEVQMCSIWNGVNGWSEENSCFGMLEQMTYRTREPLPAKYQHLVPESEEARARRLFADLKAPEGYSEPEFLGSGPVGIEEGFMYAVLVKSSGNPAWQWLHFLNGRSPSFFYARARKLPTEKEKAEAALNAYKLEPGERLVHRGERWKSKCITTYLTYDSSDGRVARTNRNYAHGSLGCYYAEIIKEPELVPFTQETWPLGAIVKHPLVEIPCVVLSHDGGGVLLNQSTRALPYETLHKDGWVYTTNQGATWSLCSRVVTRAGKGVEK